jgi:protein-S-isoprenylcysteine O-methyltransferase Ste14
MTRLAVALAGGVLFAGSLLYFGWRYAAGFDMAAAGNAVLVPVAIDVMLFTAFALHHSLFARTGFKAWVTRTIPAAFERSTYVWIASILFIAVCAAWQPVPGVVWNLSGGAAMAMRGVQMFAAIFTVAAARKLDVLDLAGIRQVLARPTDRPHTLDSHGPYGLVRHPIYLGWVLMVWPAPLMNGTRLVFAATSTLYLLIAIPLEERDLRRTFGKAYDEYSAKVRRKVLPGIY